MICFDLRFSTFEDELAPCTRRPQIRPAKVQNELQNANKFMRSIELRLFTIYDEGDKSAATAYVRGRASSKNSFAKRQDASERRRVMTRAPSKRLSQKFKNEYKQEIRNSNNARCTFVRKLKSYQNSLTSFLQAFETRP